jgi:hypothetical protein
MIAALVWNVSYETFGLRCVEAIDMFHVKPKQRSEL